MKENSVGTYSRTITTDPENAGLLNSLVDRYVLPVLQRNIAQAGMRRKTGSKRTPEQELEAVLNFGMSKPIRVPPTAKNVAHGGFNSKELNKMKRLIEFGTGKRRK